jgi:hypothetical protein
MRIRAKGELDVVDYHRRRPLEQGGKQSLPLVGGVRNLRHQIRPAASRDVADYRRHQGLAGRHLRGVEGEQRGGAQHPSHQHRENCCQCYGSSRLVYERKVFERRHERS